VLPAVPLALGVSFATPLQLMSSCIYTTLMQTSSKVADVSKGQINLSTVVVGTGWGKQVNLQDLEDG
jgi:hypothetical protein